MRIGIVGAGVSGAYLACLLGGRGEEVVLFDPRAPWEKPCGGGITSRTFRMFPILEGFRSRCLPAAAMKMIAANGESCTVSCPQSLLIASRRSLGEFLLERAVSNGALLVRERVTEIADEGGTWRVRAGGEGYSFDLLVGADGVRSLVRRRLVGRFSREETTLSVGYRIPADGEGEVTIGFLPGLSGYIWIFPRKGHLSVGIGARAGEASGKVLYGHLDDFLKRYYPLLPAVPRVRYSALIPSLSPEGMTSNRVSGENWALIGDAAGWVDPLTGEGIYYAFRSAGLAFEALSQGRIKGYEEACRKELVPELSRASSYVRAFFHPKVTARLVRLSRENAAVRNLFVNLITGRQGYLSLKTELLKIMPGLTRDMLFPIFKSE